MSDLRKFSGRSCSNSSQPRPDECELSVDQIDDPSVSNTQCLTTAAEPKKIVGMIFLERLKNFLES